MIYCRLFAMLVVIGAAACDDDPYQCDYPPSGAEDLGVGAYELRDPTTGTCQKYSTGQCPDPCTPCALDQALPDWAACNTGCEALDESQCKATAGCRAAYAASTFYQCWSVAPSGPIEGGDCTTY